LMKKTLVWHQGALGDLILSLPAIHTIKRDAETDYIHLVSRTDLRELLLSNGLIDEASSNDSGFFVPLFGGDHLPGTLMDLLREYSSAFIFARSPDLFSPRRIAECIPRTCHIRTVPPAGGIVHVSDFQLSGVRSAGLVRAVPMPVLDAGPCMAPGSSRKIFVCHPGSGGRGKCWSLENYLDLISVLSETHGYGACVLIGPAEGEEFYRSVVKGMGRRGISGEIVKDRSISYIASLLKSSAFYVGNDSGITHLASALGVPTIALFGPTDHRLWRPTGKRAMVVRSGFPCSPCDEKRYRRCGERKCLEMIGVSSVMKKICGLIRDCS
jgi:ADP-heptose:LPS heptosyltransferase